MASPQSVEKVQGILTTLLEKHRARRKIVRDHYVQNPNTGMGWLWEHGYLQARALALAFPEESEHEALNLAKDPKIAPDDLVFAIRMLDYLTQQGRSVSQNALVTVATTRGTNADVAGQALWVLLQGDKTGRYKSLYGTSSVPVGWCLDAGPYWTDPSLKKTLQSMVNDSDGSSGESFNRKFCAERALERLEIMESPESETKLELVLRDDTSSTSSLLLWTLHFVERHPTPKTLTILRERLDYDERMGSRPQGKGGNEGPDCTDPGYCFCTLDHFYDEVLLTYLALRGKLNETEIRRLTRFGYLGDPQENLENLMSMDRVTSPK